MFLFPSLRPERRRWRRQGLSTPVQVHTGSMQLDGRGIKLSEGGMCLFTLSHLDVGCEVQVEFVPPRAENRVRFSGTVRSRALYLYGIEFQNDARQHSEQPQN